MSDNRTWADRPNNFRLAGLEIAAAILRHGVTNKEIQRRMANRGWNVSVKMVAHIRQGTRRLIPRKIDILCECIGCSVEETVIIHRAAATDHGYRIGYMPAPTSKSLREPKVRPRRKVRPLIKWKPIDDVRPLGFSVLPEWTTVDYDIKFSADTDAPSV